MKNQYIREVASKGRAWTVSRFKRRLEEKEGVVFFEGMWYPIAHYGDVFKDFRAARSDKIILNNQITITIKIQSILFCVGVGGRHFSVNTKSI